MNTLVKDYYKAWRQRFRDKVPPPFGGWPPDHSEYWDTYWDHLMDVRPSRDQADAAVDVLAASPPKNQIEAFPAFKVALAGQLTSATTSGYGDREQAQSASMGWGRDPDTGEVTPCRTCHGSGLGVFVRTDGEMFDVKTPGGLRRQVRELTMTCGCPHGRWIAAQPKCPFGDSTRYGDRVVDLATAEKGPDLPRPDSERRAAEARRMLNDTLRAA